MIRIAFYFRDFSIFDMNQHSTLAMTCLTNASNYFLHSFLLDITLQHISKQ